MFLKTKPFNTCNIFNAINNLKEISSINFVTYADKGEEQLANIIYNFSYDVRLRNMEVNKINGKAQKQRLTD